MRRNSFNTKKKSDRIFDFISVQLKASEISLNFIWNVTFVWSSDTNMLNCVKMQKLGEDCNVFLYRQLTLLATLN